MTKKQFPKSKTCPKCGKNKPVDQFGFRTPKATGQKILQSYCLVCRSSGLAKTENKMKKKSKKGGKKN